MDVGAHIALARAYLAESVRLEERGVHQLAAESLTGDGVIGPHLLQSYGNGGC